MGQALTMTGKLDDISFALGELKAQGVALLRTIEDNRRIADKRHCENTDKLESIEGRVGECEGSLSKMNDVVALMKPVVDSLTVTRLKFTGALGLVLTLIGLFGWLLSLFAGKLISWVFSLFAK